MLPTFTPSGCGADLYIGTEGPRVSALWAMRLVMNEPFLTTHCQYRILTVYCHSKEDQEAGPVSAAHSQRPVTKCQLNEGVSHD